MDLSQSPDDYCRQIEAYLCRKNDGHLVRIVGPAFEQVTGWARRGVPLSVAQAGIDRYFERYYAKGPRRRPVRIDFCEADVLDAFDEWRRAVGVSDRSPVDEAADGSEQSTSSAGRRGSLPAHLERAIARLVVLRGGVDRRLDEVLDGIVRELDTARAGARGLRGEARLAFLERLRELDRTLVRSARAQCDARALAELTADADAELAPFRGRMPENAYLGAREAALDRLIRERGRLPVLALD